MSRRRVRTRSTAVTAAVAITATVTALLAGGGSGPMVAPAAAQAVGADAVVDGAAAASVTLAAIDTTVVSGEQAGWAVVVEHTGDTAWDRLEVVAELHGALGNRSALRAALAGGAAPAVARRVTVAHEPPGGIRPGGVARIAGEVPLIGRALTGSTSAVHPLRLRVVADGVEVGRVTTAVVRLGSEPAATLATTLVWPLSAPPARDADGSVATTLDTLTLPGGPLDTLLAALAGVIDTAATAGADGPGAVAQGIALAVPAHLVEDLLVRTGGTSTVPVEDADDGPPPPPPEEVDEAVLRAAQLLERLRGTALALPSGPLTLPYADADLARLLASGAALRPLATRAALEGDARTRPLLGRDPAPVLLLQGQVVPGMLDLLPGRVLVMPHGAIAGPDLTLDVPLGEPVRALRTPTGRLVTALLGDPYLTEALGASTRAHPADPLLAAHEVLVRSAMVHLEAPGRPGRALVLLPPEGFDPDPRFAAELLARLAAAPWLTPLPPERLASGADGAPDGTREPEQDRLAVTVAEPLPARLVGALATTARDLELLSGAIDLDATEPTGVVAVGPWALRDVADELLRAASRAFEGDVERAVALLQGVRSGVDGAFGVVTLAFDDVTLTASDGTLPITVRHTGGVPLRVRVEVTGPAALTWTDGRVREVTLAVDAERTIEVPVRAGASGRFPVSVRVTDPTGRRILAEDVIGVRATAVAGPALALIAGTVALLTVIGALRQRRRGLAWRTAAGPGSAGTEGAR